MVQTGIYNDLTGEGKKEGQDLAPVKPLVKDFHPESCERGIDSILKQ